jgi:integrase
LIGREPVQAAAAAIWRLWSFNRLWVAVISRHSERAADLPRRWKRSIRPLNFVCPNTGSIIALTFLHSVFEHAMGRGWARENPVRHAARPRRRRASDADPDLRFLSVPELDAVIRAIPDEIVTRAPSNRRGRPGSAPPPPPDVLGPVLRPLILAAAMSGLRQSELIGLRWRDVDFAAQRIRVRNTYVRGEHSG